MKTGSGKKETKSHVSRFTLYALRFTPLIIFPLPLLWRPLFAGEAFFWGTPLLQFVPWQRMAAEMWRAGHLPLWNHLVGCGAPLAANYQTAAFYPLNALYLLLPAEVALSWTTALHLMLAGWGMYRWARAVGLDRFPALIGALALEGSGFLVARAALFPSIAFTFPWLAVWLWRAERLTQSQRLRDALWLGLSLGLGLLAGHAQTAFYGGVLLAAYLILRTIQEAKSASRLTFHVSRFTFHVSRFTFHVSRFTLLIALSLAIGVGLAAVQLLPTAELMLSSQRSSGVSYDSAMTYSFWPWRLITLAAPDFFGNPGQGNYRGYAAYWEDAGYVGLLPLLLATEAVVSRKRACATPRTSRFTFDVSRFTFDVSRFTFHAVWFWLVSAIIALVLALGKNTPVFPFLFHHVPTFDMFQSPARWLAVTTVALAALAALGAQRWPRGHRGRRRGALGIVVGVAVLVGGLAAPRLVASVPSTFGAATARLGGTLAVAGTLALLRRDTIGWQAAVTGFVALDLLLFGWPLLPTVERSLYQNVTSTAIHLEYEPGPAARVYWPADPIEPNSDYGAEYRVKFGYLNFDSCGPRQASHWWEMREALLPNTGMLDGVPSANNFDPLLVGRYADLLEAAVETPALLRVMGVTHVISDRPWPGGEEMEYRESKTARLYRLPNALGRAWIAPAARYVPPGEMLASLTDPAFDPSAEVLLETNSLSRHSQFAIRNSLTLHDTPNRVTIHAILDAPGYLVLADTWHPGWRATVDGRPADLLRANYAFRAVRLEAGEHVVEMDYRPASVLVGATLSLTALAVLVAGLLLTRRIRI